VNAAGNWQAGQTPPGAHPELLERLGRQKIRRPTANMIGTVMDRLPVIGTVLRSVNRTLHRPPARPYAGRLVSPSADLCPVTDPDRDETIMLSEPWCDR